MVAGTRKASGHRGIDERGSRLAIRWRRHRHCLVGVLDQLSVFGAKATHQVRSHNGPRVVQMGIIDGDQHAGSPSRPLAIPVLNEGLFCAPDEVESDSPRHAP